MTLPELSSEQRAAAIEKSAAARQLRSQLRQQLKGGQITLSQAIERGRADESLAKMKVSTLLESMPGVGPVRARAVMSDIGISESRRIRGLGPNQIAMLCERFG